MALVIIFRRKLVGKSIFFTVAMMALLVSCASTTSAPVATAVNADRAVASDGREGSYLSKEIYNNNNGRVEVLNELNLMRNYSGRNIKGLLVEVTPYNRFSNRARLEVSANNRTIENHDIVVREGRQHLYTDINMEVRDDIRELSLRFDPRQVIVNSITVLLSDDRPWDNGPGNGPGPRPGGGHGNGPGPRPPMPPRIVTESCSVTRFDPSGMGIRPYSASESGPMGSNVRERACASALRECNRDIKGRQFCR
jgi:hypothetical protein